MTYNPVVWAEIPVTNMERAMMFYERLFKVKLDRYDMGPLEMAWFPLDSNGKGASAGLVKHERYIPSSQGPLIYFASPSGNIATDLKKVEQLGGKVFMREKDIGAWGWIGIFTDIEGNRIALFAAKK